jgi:hypothetical protein
MPIFLKYIPYVLIHLKIVLIFWLSFNFSKVSKFIKQQFKKASQFRKLIDRISMMIIKLFSK